MPAQTLRPDWPAPPGVVALMSLRGGGVSVAPWDSLNLRDGLGDDARAVAANHAVLRTAVPATPVFLDQVHGTRVVRLTDADAGLGAAVHRADASVTTEPGLACAIQVADCLPILFAAPHGQAVGAAHAGWRGLAGGVAKATLLAVCEAAGCEPEEVHLWLGACIGPRRFEVGADVLAAFESTATRGAVDPRFVPQRAGKWLADLPGLAVDRLRAAGARHITGGHWCTVGDESRFFSFRRDGVTGRMAALVWIERRQ